MGPLSQFHPFKADPSWYQVYWLEPAPVSSSNQWFKRLITAVSVFWNPRLRADGVADVRSALPVAGLRRAQGLG
jgi:hypothetical protein